MRRNSNKGGLFLNARRKKKIINNGLIKWRQQQRMRKDDSHEENPPFSEYQSTSQETTEHNTVISTESSPSPLTLSDPSIQHTNRINSVEECENICSQHGDLPSDKFLPTCSSTPNLPKSRRKLDLCDVNSELAERNASDYGGGIHRLADENFNEKNEKVEIIGRRIINFSSFFDQIKKINNHNKVMGCTIDNMDYVKETRFGLKSKIILKCNMCNLTCSVNTDNVNSRMDVNTASVAGSMAIGIGHYQLEELLSAMEIPVMSVKTYLKYHDRVSDGWEATALQEMEAAASEEVRLAVAEGNVSPEGLPILTVVADGGWAKRSYRTNYTSLSGVAAIVGSQTKKVLFLGVRNKYCTICARAAVKAMPASTHNCYKNWTGSSSSMEADIILEGFRRSIEMYGAIYGTILADGDSNVYSKLVESRPYCNWTVDKIECTNHLLRNYCTKLREIVVDKNTGPIQLRKVVGSNILRLRTAVSKAAQHRKQQSNINTNDKLLLLQKDLVNSASHIFGEHFKCKELGYFCIGPKNGEKNYVPEMKQTGIYQKVMRHISFLTDRARSLLLNKTNNPAEQFNSIVAKFIGGKRINYTMKRSYKARCSAAVVSHNTKLPLYTLHKTMCNKSPGKVLKSQQRKRADKIIKAALRRKTKPCKKSKGKISQQEKVENKKSYGHSAQKPDMTPEIYDQRKKEFLESLCRSENGRKEIERATSLQAGSGLWKEERRKLLTASNFGTVCKRRNTTSCEKLVKTLLYTDVESTAMRYGKDNEINAISQLEDSLNVRVKRCGLFIDKDIPYLGASPDGLVGTDCTVEVKCPESCKNLTPDEAVRTGKFTFLNSSITSECVNKNHNFYFQIQGQLHITQRAKCYFVLWTPLGFRIEIIVRDDDFWSNHMVENLKRFYINCLLPELVDPRHTRSMEIRNPEYIFKAIQVQKSKKAKMLKPSVQTA